MIKPSLIEQEKIDEEELEKTISILNKKFKNKNDEDFIHAITKFYEKSLNSSGMNEKIDPAELKDKLLEMISRENNKYDTDSTPIKSNRKETLFSDTSDKKNYSGRTKFESSASSLDPDSIGLGLSSENETVKFSEFENIITKNVNVFEDTLKILLIGDKMTGKTSFIKQVQNLNSLSDSKDLFSMSYLPTNRYYLFKLI